MAVPPREAFLGEAEVVAVDDAVGRVSRRVDRRLPAGHPGAAAGRADHRRGRRVPARAARRRRAPARRERPGVPRPSYVLCDERRLDGRPRRARARRGRRRRATRPRAATVDADARARRARSPRRRRGSSSAWTLAEEAFRALDPDAQIAAARDRRAYGARAGRCCASRAGARALLGRRAHGAELPRPAVRRRHADRARAVRGGRGHRRPASSTRARPRPACARWRRRRSRAGGGVNHRAGLYDAILIKENHAALAGGVGEAVRRRAGGAPGRSPLEVEVPRHWPRSTRRWRPARTRLLLDNMTPGACARPWRAWRAARRSRPAAASRSKRSGEIATDGRRLHLDRRADALGAALDLSLTLEPTP